MIYTFIGFGLIGGSIAKRLRQNDAEAEIRVYSRTMANVEPALADGVASRLFDSVSDPELLAGSDIVYLCTPVVYIEDYLRQIAPTILENPACSHTIVTDVGSTKASILESIRRCSLTSHYVGGHPMAGSEKTGYRHAKAHLLENAYYILTPTEDTPAEMTECMRTMAASLGAIPLVLDAREHDYAVAAISHLPHLIAASLVNLVKDSDSRDEVMKRIAAGGFRDITRIASSSPEMWEQICMTNQAPIVDMMNRYIDSLSSIRNSIEESRGQDIYDLFDTSRTYRDSISNRNLGPIPMEYSIVCDIVDETGAIAQIATLLAIHQISIKNIGIIHNREQEEGVLKIDFYNQEAKDAAEQVLKNKMYTIFPR